MTVFVRLALGFAVFVLLASLVFAADAESQSDAGEPDPLRVACSHLTAVGVASGLRVYNCRRAAPDVIEGRTAQVTVRLGTDQGPFVLETRMQKSLWHVSAFTQR